MLTTVGKLTSDVGTLAVPAGVAHALVEWIRRARVEIAYLPSNSAQRRQLVQAAYVTETLVRGMRDGEVFLPNPKITYAQVERLRSMIELNQDIRRCEARCRELDQVRPWLSAWHAAIRDSAGAMATGVPGISSAASLAPVEKRYLGISLNRFYFRLRCGITFLAVAIAIPALSPDQTYQQLEKNSGPQTPSAIVPAPDLPAQQPHQADTDGSHFPHEVGPADAIPAFSPAGASAQRAAGERRPSARQSGRRAKSPAPVQLHRSAAVRLPQARLAARRAAGTPPEKPRQHRPAHAAPSLF